MKLVRYVYPIEGNVVVEEWNAAGNCKRSTKMKNISGRYEIFNIHGDMVTIARELKMIKMLNLQNGYYLIREKDINGRVVNSRKIVI